MNRHYENNVSNLFGQMELLDTGSGLVSGAGLAADESWAESVGQRVRAKLREQSTTEVRKRTQNVSWFLGIYVVSVLSFSGVVGSVRWMLTLI